MSSGDVWILGITMTKFGKRPDDDTIDIMVDKGPLVDLDADDSSGATGSAFKTTFNWTGASLSASEPCGFSITSCA